IVRDETTDKAIWWDNSNAMSREHFDVLYNDFLEHAKGKHLFAQDLYGGADPAHRVKVRVFTELAWHSLFIRTMLIRPPAEDLRSFTADMTIIDLPSFRADANRHGCRAGSDTVIAVDFTRKIVLIGGSSYAGEMKKSVFGYLNFVLPAQKVMPMHCSANVGPKGDCAIFFGLSGTGKTTLSADGSRTLIGDDEHGWSPRGIFNFEGGCYAKVINLSPTAEPEIYATITRFGTVLENVVFDPVSRMPDVDDNSLTENTRACYPLDFIPNADPHGMAPHPKNVIMLTCDAFGVMPPIAKLSSEQAMYHFLSGYTAQVAGTEVGLGKEPKAVFSTCFGAPFMPRHPSEYAKMLGERISRFKADCWLVNTGWSGGAYGVGKRMAIAHTRALLRAALDGSLAQAPMRQDTNFGFLVPESCADLPPNVLDPRGTWSDKRAYDEIAGNLRGNFEKNFAAYEPFVGSEVKRAAIRAAA
ncbi:MAG: phosphoenolpyruvate carboxykinase, partial [Alphaproteobacteria bacterium]|nr:phosphoenolpyruvate carboxykinase [Alphaproteobacteria bacterium]